MPNRPQGSAARLSDAERLARHLFGIAYADEPDKPWDQAPEWIRDVYWEQARHWLKTLREAGFDVSAR